MSTDNAFDPLVGLKILNEDMKSWKEIFDFQNRYIKNKNALSLLSFTGLKEEFDPKFNVLKRKSLRELKDNKKELISQIKLLEDMMQDYPKLDQVKNLELKSLMRIIFLRISHTRNIRMALLYRGDSKIHYQALIQARNDRHLAQKEMDSIRTNFNRYPESFVFKFHYNPTQYNFGYAALANTLHYWKRDELMVRDNNFSPFYYNVFDILDTLF